MSSLIRTTRTLICWSTTGWFAWGTGKEKNRKKQRRGLLIGPQCCITHLSSNLNMGTEVVRFESVSLKSQLRRNVALEVPTPKAFDDGGIFIFLHAPLSEIEGRRFMVASCGPFYHLFWNFGISDFSFCSIALFWLCPLALSCFFFNMSKWQAFSSPKSGSYANGETVLAWYSGIC